eukprot:FR735766.1.p2 GENE.FR735766.1~~FR735766.1.p2  ORF type:complete len:109 (-),score=30.02 FR735766.1:779-1105(-)
MGKEFLIITGGTPDQVSPVWEKGAGGDAGQNKWKVDPLLLGPPRLSPIRVPGSVFGGEWGGGKQIFPGKQVRAKSAPRGANYPPKKGNKKGGLHRGGRPFKKKGTPWV